VGCAERKKSAYSSGEMNRTAELFGDEAMGYTAPVAKGAALGYPEQQHGGFTDLLGARQEMGRMSLEEQRYLQMGGAIPDAPIKHNPRGSRTQNPNTGMMLAAQGNLFEEYGNVKQVTNVGPINWTEAPRGVPKTPEKGLGPAFGNVGRLPGEEKKAPSAPMKLNFGQVA